LLQSMPVEWQRRFIGCIEEMQDSFRHVDQAYQFRVLAMDVNGKFVKDPVPHYNRGRTHVDPKPGVAA
jgi:hypothetical protein